MKEKSLTLLKNPIFIGYIFVYLIFLLLLHFIENFPITEPLVVLFIIGIGFSGLALLLTKSSKPFHISRQVTGVEMLALMSCLILIIIYLTWGNHALNIIIYKILPESDLVKHVMGLIKKLIFFVIIPLFIFIKFFKYSIIDFGLRFKNDQNQWKSHLKVLIGMSLIFILFNYFLGQGARPIREGQFSTQQLIIGLPITYLWLVIEVGLVEEFFFRGLIQSRLTAYYKSEVTAIVLTCLIFGLAHAPGLILRGAGTITPVGESPSILLGVGYTIVTLSVTGFCFGIIWSRTKNLFVLMLIHAAGDLMPSFSELVKVFHI